MAEVGSGLVRLRAPGVTRGVSVDASVRVLSPEASHGLVGVGVVMIVEMPVAIDFEVEVDYSSFADAVGGGFGSRLHLVSLPTCALISPSVPECLIQTDLVSVNDGNAQTVRAVVETQVGEFDSSGISDGAVVDDEMAVDSDSAVVDSVAGGKSVDMERFVVAVVGGSRSGEGDYGVTPMSVAGSWAGGGRTGEFRWSYPLGTPTVPGEIGPELLLAYSSGLTDGGVSNTNNQASWVGEGFNLNNAYIERRFVSCADDMAGGNNPVATGDLCWFSDSLKPAGVKHLNAFLVLGDHSGQLVQIGTTNQWRLKDDDGTRIKLNSYNGVEGWSVQTLDGVSYEFGRGKPVSGVANTNSVWSVPVAGNHVGEPGYSASGFASSFQSQPYRWNLDRVSTPTGKTMTLFYVKEANQYKRNGTTLVSYDRGGYLARIQYGEASGQETNDAAQGRVVFTVEERCDTSVLSTCKTATPTAGTVAAWPDVPMDALCEGAFCPSPKASPTFFSRKRLSSVATFTRNAGNTGYDTVDQWDMGYLFLKPTDGSATALWLSTITHKGLAGGNVTLPAVKLTPTMMKSSITGTAMSRPRLTMITNESGGQSIVTYSTPECTTSTVPTSTISANTTRCMPSYYSSSGGTPVLQWFNKYVVVEVVDHDVIPLGNGLDPSMMVTQDVITSYVYSGGGAWRFNESPYSPLAYRTWSIWRGYSVVTTKVGTGTAQQTTEVRYFRGMHGDKAASGTKTVYVSDSTGALVLDEEWLNGRVRETRILTTTGV
ncbi:MAG: hypothetical protein FWD55_01925, partial [Propionibacteriaceae bacterium]|nr:hypothetical protein [Propionibacteriaceae bacterium]